MIQAVGSSVLQLHRERVGAQRAELGTRDHRHRRVLALPRVDHERRHRAAQLRAQPPRRDRRELRGEVAPQRALLGRRQLAAAAQLVAQHRAAVEPRVVRRARR